MNMEIDMDKGREAHTEMDMEVDNFISVGWLSFPLISRWTVPRIVYLPALLRIRCHSFTVQFRLMYVPSYGPVLATVPYIIFKKI
jgi:hypothetical protein